MIAASQAFLGQRLSHDAIKTRVIELAQLAEEIGRRLAQISGCAQATGFDEGL
jgi:hypothetical protein